MANPLLKAGDLAPDFRLPTDSGGELARADLAGKRAVVYFYPADDTPGCTTEACDFRDNMQRLTTKGVAVVGVSPDSVESHQRFKKKYGLTFPLLADTDKKMAEAYGAWREKQNYGRTYVGLVRSTFVIGPDGHLEKVYDAVKAQGHVDRIIQDLGL
jgi:peroxiredoxin Q/BCP